MKPIFSFALLTLLGYTLTACQQNYIELDRELKKRLENYTEFKEEDWRTLILPLIRRGANPDLKIPLSDFAYRPVPILFLAVKKNFPQIVKELLAEGADPNLLSGQESPLIWALSLSHLDIARILLNHPEIKILVKDTAGRQPIHYAAMFRDTSILEILLKKGVDPNAVKKYGVTPLHLSCMQPYLEPIRLLCSRHADLDKADNFGWTPLHFAVWKNNPDVVNWLIDQGCVKNPVTKMGSTPSQIAASNNNEEMISLLKRKNAFFLPQEDAEKELGVIISHPVEFIQD